MKRSLLNPVLHNMALIVLVMVPGLMPQVSWAEIATATVTAGARPWAIAVNPSTDKIYVANNISGSITVINGFTNVPTSVVVGTGTYPWAIAVNKDTNKTYVANNGNGTVSVIDGDNNVETITLAPGTFPYAIALNDNKVYVANYSGRNISVIDIANANAVTTITVGMNPVSIAVNGSKVYVANKGSATVTVIDTANANSTKNVGVGIAPAAIAVNADTNKVYVANSGNEDPDNIGSFINGSFTVIDGETDIADTTELIAGSSPVAVAVNSITNKVYVSNRSLNTVTVIDGASGTSAAAVLGTTPVGVNPVAIVVNPFNNRIYVANQGLDADRNNDSISIIDGFVPSSATTIPGGGDGPTAISVNTTTNRVYAANKYSNNVSVIVDAPNNGLAVTINNATGSGNGGVNSNPTGISCTKGGNIGCSLTFDSGESVTLTAVAEATTSVFLSWSGACNSEPCTIIMDSNEAATASFALVPRCKLTQTAPDGYGTLQEAYNNTDSKMYALQGLFSNEWKLDQGKNIVLKGGYLAEYKDATRNGFTTLTGKLSIKSGSLVVDSLKIKPPSP
jgi:YVTN family beta-propeller protein